MKKLVYLSVFNFEALQAPKCSNKYKCWRSMLIALSHRHRKAFETKVNMYEGLLRDLLPYQCETARLTIQSSFKETCASTR